ncbi:hypothetical protein FA15DRAFT_729398 [Coprinopsis marcescibilis]|uniref:Uncharacterized protein n=1 Tax=Coprinopsis marcescibilis TaxID=230819 RepID=A0A5C3KEJ8_COPMA|nr:hypothetical protein FA15DRAFT_729398 [Coprinopsis marcescibilis]
MATRPTLPARKQNRAPTWDKTPATLRQYFEDVTEICKECEVQPNEWPKIAIRYVPASEHDLWTDTLNDLETKSWEKFIKAIYDLYPGSDEDKRYTRLTSKTCLRLHPPSQ